MNPQFKPHGRGPIGTPTNAPASDPGTSARIKNRPSAPLGAVAIGDLGPRSRLSGGRKRKSQLPQLQMNSRGPDVERLQRLLNSRLQGGGVLKVDGKFGPKTRAAVVEFQKKSKLAADGIVGRRSWFALLSAPLEKAAPPPKPTSPAGVIPPVAAPAAAPPVAYSASPVEKSVDEWSLEERFTYVLLHTGNYLGPELRTQFTALLTPVNLGIMISSLVVWAGGHFFGVSELADAFLLGFGLVFIGKAALDAASDLKNFVELTCTASTKKELEEAAADLAQAISIIGVVAFFALLAKVARSIGKKASKAGEKGASPSSEEGTPQPSKAKPEVEPSKRATESETPTDESIKKSTLNEKQIANLKRFEKSLPSKAGATRINDLPDGGKVFQADVPADNIPGSFARYEKIVDVEGNTVKYTKTTFAPDGSIVHVKQKFP